LARPTYATQQVEGKPFQLDFVLGDAKARSYDIDCRADSETGFVHSDHLPVVTTLRW